MKQAPTCAAKLLCILEGSFLKMILCPSYCCLFVHFGGFQQLETWAVLQEFHLVSALHLELQQINSSCVVQDVGLSTSFSCFQNSVCRSSHAKQLSGRRTELLMIITIAKRRKKNGKEILACILCVLFHDKFTLVQGSLMLEFSACRFSAQWLAQSKCLISLCWVECYCEDSLFLISCLSILVFSYQDPLCLPVFLCM